MAALPPRGAEPAAVVSIARHEVFAAVADELGVSVPELKSKIHAGTRLADIIQTAGVPSGRMNATISAALQRCAPLV